MLIRFQQDIRVEHLLMEREVKMAYERLTNNTDDNLVYYENFKNDLLEGIIKESVDREVRQEAFSRVIFGWLLVLAIITFMFLALQFMAKRAAGSTKGYNSDGNDEFIDMASEQRQELLIKQANNSI